MSRGRDWFTKLNCGACHSGKDLPAGRPALPLPSLKSNATKGCLAENALRVPQYQLSAVQRDAGSAPRLGTWIPSPRLSPTQQVESTLTRLNCYALPFPATAWEDRPPPDARTGSTSWGRILGDEGRIPPALTGWVPNLNPPGSPRCFAREPRCVPTWPPACRSLAFRDWKLSPHKCVQRTCNPNAPTDPTLTTRDAKFGWKLVGTDGLSCVACHTFAQYPSLGIPALGLGTMGHRLEGIGSAGIFPIRRRSDRVPGCPVSGRRATL